MDDDQGVPDFPTEELPLCKRCKKRTVEAAGFYQCRECIAEQGGKKRRSMPPKRSALDEDPAAPGLDDALPPDHLDAVKIDDLALDEEFLRFCRDLAYWNARYARANERYLEVRHDYEMVRAQLWLEIKEEEKAAESKATIDDIKAMVFLREEHDEAHLKLIKAEAERERLKKFSEALAAKRDMLKEIGAKLRIEMLGDPTIRELQREVKQYGG